MTGCIGEEREGDICYGSSIGKITKKGGYSIYTNVSVPWQAEDNRSTASCPAAPVNFNPVGLYRKTFTVDEGLKSSGGRIYLNFQGVESAYYVRCGQVLHPGDHL